MRCSDSNRMPNMTQHLVCLTFDFDAMSGLVARGLTTPTPISRGEFGAVAVPRILDLLKRHGIKASFFIPGAVFKTYPQLCERIIEDGHEVGNHGWSHVPPSSLSRDEEEAGLQRSNELIKSLTGRQPAGYRSPSWDLGENTLERLIDHGYVYESRRMVHDYAPYFVRQGDEVHADGSMTFGTPTSLIEMPISWSLDDFPHFEFLRMENSVMQGLMNAESVLGNWTADYDYLRTRLDWGILTYTFHPYVIGRGHRMLILERLIQHLADNGATFVTLRSEERRVGKYSECRKLSDYQ